MHTYVIKAIRRRTSVSNVEKHARRGSREFTDGASKRLVNNYDEINRLGVCNVSVGRARANFHFFSCRFDENRAPSAVPLVHAKTTVATSGKKS